MLTEKIEVHDELNKYIWEQEKLKDDVREAILDAVDEFMKTCDIPLNVADIQIVGSQASYNYNKDSDLDVHIICNFELMNCSKDVLQAAYNAIRTKFNSDYTIKLFGVNLEIYVDDINSGVVSNGIYSVKNNKWIKFPKHLDDVTSYDVTEDLLRWKTRIEKAINSGNVDNIESCLNDLYAERKNSLAVEGEYGYGNQLFKEIRNYGLLDELRHNYREIVSKQLSLESYKPLKEDSRAALIARSKQSSKGMMRYRRRVKSKVANSVKQYNSIDMNKLFKKDILTMDVNVKGETDDYVVKISFGGFTELLQQEVKKQNGKLDSKAVTRALIDGFNKDDVYISCTCPDWKYRFAYFATKNNIIIGDPETRSSDITNPDDKLGPACKHVLLVLSNTSFLLKVASTIYNYINYMEKHYHKLYADYIYPAVYGKKYEDPVQLDVFDDDELASDKDTLDKSNQEASKNSKFKPGNDSGVRYSPKDLDQISVEDTTNNQQ